VMWFGCLEYWKIDGFPHERVSETSLNIEYSNLRISVFQVNGWVTMTPAMIAEARAMSSFMGTLLPLSGKFRLKARSSSTESSQSDERAFYGSILRYS
jgi:hypothetical protein